MLVHGRLEGEWSPSTLACFGWGNILCTFAHRLALCIQAGFRLLILHSSSHTFVGTICAKHCAYASSLLLPSNLRCTLARQILIWTWAHMYPSKISEGNIEDIYLVTSSNNLWFNCLTVSSKPERPFCRPIVALRHFLMDLSSAGRFSISEFSSWLSEAELLKIQILKPRKNQQVLESFETLIYDLQVGCESGSSLVVCWKDDSWVLVQPLNQGT